MEKEFDFKNIGKQMPYRTPDGFFDRMQEQVSARTKVEKHKKQLRMNKYLPILYLWQPVLTTHIRMQWIIL